MRQIALFLLLSIFSGLAEAKKKSGSTSGKKKNGFISIIIVVVVVILVIIAAFFLYRFWKQRKAKKAISSGQA